MRFFRVLVQLKTPILLDAPNYGKAEQFREDTLKTTNLIVFQ